MISSLDGLRQARMRWLAAGKDPELFDQATQALMFAATNIDVMNALPSPTFRLRAVDGADPKHADLWRIYANGEPILDYELREADPYAEVTILPGLD